MYDVQGHLVYDKDYLSRLDIDDIPSVAEGSVQTFKSKKNSSKLSSNAKNKEGSFEGSSRKHSAVGKASNAVSEVSNQITIHEQVPAGSTIDSGRERI